MADKAISELVAAEQITATDMFVLEQNNTAKKLTGQILLNWLTKAADGHGGIQSIVKQSTSGLTDTYRITLADTTTFDFTVTNGKSITSISKQSTSDLVDTYKISYNDGTSTTFTVTNGAKGDKGDNAYLWIKYASQKPTAGSHSIGDVPDDWIGVYSGNSATAPTDYAQYNWFQYKGEKGNKGDPATIQSQAVAYQVSDSGTIIPSGVWSASVPVVAQGKYLWTRTTVSFNSGNPVVSYSVSRMGLDGSGAVSSVAGVSPDSDGNVPLTPANIGALPTTGGTMTGPLNVLAPTANANAANKEYVDTSVAEKVDKDSVVNNFTTTREGFVADARAVAVLHDGAFPDYDAGDVFEKRDFGATETYIEKSITADEDCFVGAWIYTAAESAQPEILITTVGGTVLSSAIAPVEKRYQHLTSSVLPMRKGQTLKFALTGKSGCKFTISKFSGGSVDG